METRQQRRMETIQQQIAGKMSTIVNPTYQTLQEKMVASMKETLAKQQQENTQQKNRTKANQ